MLLFCQISGNRPIECYTRSLLRLVMLIVHPAVWPCWSILYRYVPRLSPGREIPPLKLLLRFLTLFSPLVFPPLNQAYQGWKVLQTLKEIFFKPYVLKQLSQNV